MLQPSQRFRGKVLGALSIALLVFGGMANADPAAQHSVVDPVNYSAGHVWLNAGLGASVQSMATGHAGQMVALTADETVFRREAGQSWREVLGPPGLRLEDATMIDDERILLDVEGFLEEQQDLAEQRGRTPSSRSDADDDEGEEEAIEPRDLGTSTDAISDLTDLYVEETQGDGSSMVPRSGRLVWMSRSIQGLVFVERSDGLWKSDDQGHTWARTESLPGVHAMIDGGNGTIIAGTEIGVRVSKDLGNSWQALNDPIAKVETFCFAVDAAIIYAGTIEGLYRTTDGLRWAKLLSRHDADVPVWAIEIDAHWERGIWVAGPVGILRSDDGGHQLRSAGQNTLMGTVSLLAMDSPGHLLAAGIDGVWESMDGGLRWRPIVNGLPSPANRQLLLGRNGPLVAGVDGVYDLRVADKAVVEAATEIVRDPVGADMYTLVRVALNRPGMAIEEVLIKQSIIRAVMLPELTLNGRLDRSSMITADYDAEANIGSRRRSWSFGLTACFGGCRSGAGYTDYLSDDAIGYDVDPGVIDDAVTVVAGEVYDATGTASLAPMAANVAEQVTRYRTDVSGRVSEMILARHRLLEARSVMHALSLREQVGHELDILESAARLDVYTNGYFTRVLTGS
jgi:hypothetical protein